MVINTPLGEVSRYDEFAIGWSALEQKISVITTLSAASAAVRGIQRQRAESLDVRSIQDYLSA